MFISGSPQNLTKVVFFTHVLAFGIKRKRTKGQERLCFSGTLGLHDLFKKAPHEFPQLK